MRIVSAVLLVLLIALGFIYKAKFSSSPDHPVKIIKKKLLQLHLPDKPSIVVLPFMNMSGDKEQEYFSDGMTEDLITDLSKISGLFVIARNSAFSYKGKNVKAGKIGKELGVRYILEGSVRKVGDRVRITAQLIDASTEGHIWAERYDRDLEDIFALQDEVREKIIAALAVQLTSDDKKRMQKPSAANLEAYDYFLRGMELFALKMNKGLGEARKMFQKAIELDPNYARAYSALGHTWLTEWIFGFNQDPEILSKALELGKKALSINEDESSGYSLLANVALWTKQNDKAVTLSQKAVALDPNNAMLLAYLGEQLTWSDRPQEGILYLQKAMRLDPKYPSWYLWNLGHAYYLAGEYDQAIDTFKRALARDQDFWPSIVFLAVSYKAKGLNKEAKKAAENLFKTDKAPSLEQWEKRLPYKNPEHASHLIKVLKGLGVK